MDDLTITYYGHALFVIKTSGGIKIGTDPYDEQIKEPLPAVSADIVTSSHDHFDHANIALFKGNPRIINSPGETVVGDIRFEGIPSFHDEKGGSLRGTNIIYRIMADGVVITHLGDLGHMPDRELVSKLDDTDILLIPVGGVYTINAAQAVKLIGLIRPKIAIPMHYKERDSKLNVDEVSSFTRRLDDFKEAGHSFSVNNRNLTGSTEIRVMTSS
jgi:L-ascorbate metabolism protein UlaG (beta-lactamase superfamily)